MDHLKVSLKIIKILLSLSLLSLLFSSLPLLFQSHKSFFNFSISKSCVFLFCNGLIVFIAKNSAGLSIASLEFEYLDIVALIYQVNGMEANSPVQEEEEEEEEEESMIMVDSHKEDEVSDIEKEEDEEEASNAYWIMDEEEHDADELNKKCEDFIRKMKATFCLEPRAHHHSYNYI